MVKIPKEKSTIKERLVDIDTSSVYRIIIIPKGLPLQDFSKKKRSMLSKASWLFPSAGNSMTGETKHS
jgi:hypothetical protein